MLLHDENVDTMQSAPENMRMYVSSGLKDLAVPIEVDDLSKSTLYAFQKLLLEVKYVYLCI
jgi:hypothetical protein